MLEFVRPGSPRPQATPAIERNRLAVAFLTRASAGLVCALAALASAQTPRPPQELLDMIKREGPVRLPDPPPAMARMLDSGVYLVQAPPGYGRIVEQFARSARKANAPGDRTHVTTAFETACQCGLLGRLDESPNRTTFVFGKAQSPRFALTVWNYKRDGARVVSQPAEYWTSRIGTSKASIAFATGSDPAGTWKATWIRGPGGSDPVQIELYMAATSRMPADGELELLRKVAQAVDLQVATPP